MPFCSPIFSTGVYVFISNSSKHFCSSYYVPGPLKIKSILTTTLRGGHYYYSHFTNEEIEAKRFTQLPKASMLKRVPPYCLQGHTATLNQGLKTHRLSGNNRHMTLCLTLGI